MIVWARATSEHCYVTCIRCTLSKMTTFTPSCTSSAGNALKTRCRVTYINCMCSSLHVNPKFFKSGIVQPLHSGMT